MAGSSGDPSWKNALRGHPVWVSSDSSPEEVAELEREFPKIVRVPEDEQQDEVARWEEIAVVARCFGRWVAPEAIVREFQRAGVAGDVQAFGMACGYYIFNLANAGEQVKVVDRSWTVNGQILAVEEWRRAFLPSEDAITSALVWVRLPHLPAELWGEAALQRLVEDAEEFMMADDFTSERRHLGFARVCIRVDLSRPLLLGVWIDCPNDVYWQRYAYENLTILYLDCGSVIHLCGRCSRGDGRKKKTEGEGITEVKGEEGNKAPVRRGAWMVAVRRWSTESGAPLLPGNPNPSGIKAAVQTAAGDWRNPPKVARRGKAPLNPPLLLSGGEVADGEGGSRAFARVPASRASPERRPNNPFLVLGRLGEEDPLGSGLGGSVLSKRARQQLGLVGRATLSRSDGFGPVRPRKLGLSSSKGKGKGLAVPEHPVAVPGREVFHFSTGEGEDSSTQPADPLQVCARPLVWSSTHLRAET